MANVHIHCDNLTPHMRVEHLESTESWVVSVSNRVNDRKDDVMFHVNGPEIVAEMALKLLASVQRQTSCQFVLCEVCGNAYDKRATEYLNGSEVHVCYQCYDNTYVATCVACEKKFTKDEMDANGSGEWMCHNCITNQALTAEEYREVDMERKFEEGRIDCRPIYIDGAGDYKN